MRKKIPEYLATLLLSSLLLGTTLLVLLGVYAVAKQVF